MLSSSKLYLIIEDSIRIKWNFIVRRRNVYCMWSGTSYIIFLLGERETNIIDLKKKKKKKKIKL